MVFGKKAKGKGFGPAAQKAFLAHLAQTSTHRPAPAAWRLAHMVRDGRARLWQDAHAGCSIARECRPGHPAVAALPPECEI